ncbi:hypothetical protein [Actinomadura opuntiae]|uniref:hypothetical protein n=1 Tax=Actinomadura sp. OS1-43 TaxID=604315 RepID=UPI004063B0E7
MVTVRSPERTPKVRPVCLTGADGRRARALIDDLFSAGAGVPPADGMIAAHFFCSLDGSQVLNYALWTSARDYETLPTRSEAMIHVAMSNLMTRRHTGEATVTWRDT